MYSTFLATIGSHPDLKIEEDLLRHIVLNSIRSFNIKWKSEFGNLVIATDGLSCWRKKIFPYYKATRKKTRDSSKYDWKSIFEIMNKIKNELKEFFPYPVIYLDEAEADDIIATLVNSFGNEKILIISGDKDFIQLHDKGEIIQYDPVRKRIISHLSPSKYLKEHIIRGDAGDGIPNILTNDTSFIKGERQKRLSTKKIEEWLEQDPSVFCNDEMFRNYKRNEQLIDLKSIPISLSQSILENYNKETGKNRSKMLNYFIDKNLKNLLSDIGDF